MMRFTKPTVSTPIVQDLMQRVSVRDELSVMLVAIKQLESFKECDALLAHLQSLRQNANETLEQIVAKYKVRREGLNNSPVNSSNDLATYKNICTQLEKAEKRECDEVVYFLKLTEALEQRKAELIFPACKDSIAKFINTQLARLRPQESARNKVLGLERCLVLCNDSHDVQTLQAIIDLLRTVIDKHQDDGFVGLVMKFNWYRNTSSSSALTDAFEENDELYSLGLMSKR